MTYIPMKNLLNEQFSTIVDQWGANMEKFYPNNADEWKDPSIHLDGLTKRWNYIDAAKLVDFNSLFTDKDDLVALDLGCGTGWLSALLSKYKKVKRIDALDSDFYNLNDMLPHIVKKLDGDISKIQPIRALFSPLFTQDETYDLIVASSSVHHAPELIPLLLELKRVLKPNGHLVILNETPIPNFIYQLRLIKFFTSFFVKTFSNSIDLYSPKVASNGILYDPYLGDIAYSLKQWKLMFKESALRYEIVNTPLYTLKNKKNQRYKLTHFICQKQ